MFNKFLEVIKFKKEITFILKIEHLFNANCTFLDVFNYLYKNEDITFNFLFLFFLYICYNDYIIKQLQIKGGK